MSGRGSRQHAWRAAGVEPIRGWVRQTSVVGVAMLAVAMSGAAGIGRALGGFVSEGHVAVTGLATASARPAAPGTAASSRTRIERELLSGNATARRHVSLWRRDLTRTHSRLLDAWLARPDSWRDELVPILESHRVPPEFLYLALLESGMDPDAVSPGRAVGLWQFTESTARQYGLLVDDRIDQRRDWRLATSAAGRYLRDLYDLFGTWELAAAAYNGGPGRVSRALQASGAESYWGLVERGQLPAETREYVPKFLAIVELAQERAGP